MFFYISGMAATFFNTEGKGFGIYFTDKVFRLAVPFVVGIFVFLVPRPVSYTHLTLPTIYSV